MNVIFHADDMGLSRESDVFFYDCIENGNCTSVSLLANGANFTEAADFLKQHPEVSVSVHLNVVEGKPLTRPEKRAEPFINEDNFFSCGFLGLWKTMLCSKESSKEWLFNEMETQVERIRTKLGGARKISVDGHVHIHMLPPILKQLPVFCDKFGLDSMRIPREPIDESVVKHLGNLGLVKNLVLNTLALQSTPLKSRSDCVVGVLNTGKMTKGSLIEDLKKCHHYNDVEVILHPAYIRNGLRFYANPHRLVEAALFKDKDLENAR